MSNRPATLCLLVFSVLIFPISKWLFSTKISNDEIKSNPIVLKDVEGIRTLIPCFDQILACSTNEECTAKCHPKNVEWVCNNRACLPRIKRTTNREDCLPENGGIWTITNLQDTYNLIYGCLCLYPELFHGPNCNLTNPFTCSNGGVLLRREEFSGRGSCHCPLKDHVKVDYKSSAYGRNTPLCVPEKLKPFLTRSNKFSFREEEEFDWFIS